MLPEVLHAAIQFRDNLAGDWDFGWMLLQIVPQFGDENQFLGRREPLHFWKLLKNHAAIITTAGASAGRKAQGAASAFAFGTVLLERERTQVIQIQHSKMVALDHNAGTLTGVKNKAFRM